MRRLVYTERNGGSNPYHGPAAWPVVWKGIISMAKFACNDIVTVRAGVGHGLPNGRACVVGVFEDRPSGVYFDKFPLGVVYTVEFEDGSSGEIHEDNLVAERVADCLGAPTR